jgi:hypothetical protein
MPVLGLHVLDLRLLKFENAVTFPAVAADPGGIEILFVLLQGRLSGNNRSPRTQYDIG